MNSASLSYLLLDPGRQARIDRGQQANGLQGLMFAPTYFTSPDEQAVASRRLLGAPRPLTESSSLWAAQSAAQKVGAAKQAFAEKLTAALTDAGISQQASFELRIAPDKSIQVIGDAADSLKLEAIFAQNEDLAQDFRAICWMVSLSDMAPDASLTKLGASPQEALDQIGVYQQYRRETAGRAIFGGGQLAYASEDFHDSWMTQLSAADPYEPPDSWWAQKS
jgi:hypothetical protein